MASLVSPTAGALPCFKFPISSPHSDPERHWMTGCWMESGQELVLTWSVGLTLLTVWFTPPVIQTILWKGAPLNAQAGKQESLSTLFEKQFPGIWGLERKWNNPWKALLGDYAISRSKSTAPGSCTTSLLIHPPISCSSFPFSQTLVLLGSSLDRCSLDLNVTVDLGSGRLSQAWFHLFPLSLTLLNIPFLLSCWTGWSCPARLPSRSRAWKRDAVFVLRSRMEWILDSE